MSEASLSLCTTGLWQMLSHVLANVHGNHFHLITSNSVISIQPAGHSLTVINYMNWLCFETERAKKLARDYDWNVRRAGIGLSILFPCAQAYATPLVAAKQSLIASLVSAAAAAATSATKITLSLLRAFQACMTTASGKLIKSNAQAKCTTACRVQWRNCMTR